MNKVVRVIICSELNDKEHLQIWDVEPNGGDIKWLALDMAIEPTDDDQSKWMRIVHIPFRMGDGETFVRPTDNQLRELISEVRKENYNLQINLSEYQKLLKAANETDGIPNDVINCWTMYVTDDDKVTCHQDGCEGNFISIGRRKTFGEIRQDLVDHLKEEHNL